MCREGRRQRIHTFYTKYFLYIDILHIETYTSFICWLYKLISKLPELMIVLPEFELMHVDEFIDELLHSERVCDIILPRLQVRDKDVLSELPFSPQDRETDKYTYTIKH